MKEDIIKLLKEHQETVKIGSDGDYMQEQAIIADNFDILADKIAALYRDSIDELIKKIEEIKKS